MRYNMSVACASAGGAVYMSGLDSPLLLEHSVSRLAGQRQVALCVRVYGPRWPLLMAGPYLVLL